jgi:hypothetical protein
MSIEVFGWRDAFVAPTALGGYTDISSQSRTSAASAVRTPPFSTPMRQSSEPAA